MLRELRNYSWTSKKRKQNGKISKNRTKSYFNENDEETLAVGGGGRREHVYWRTSRGINTTASPAAEVLPGWGG